VPVRIAWRRIAALAACVAIVAPVARAQAPSLEAAVKATYLHKIAAFVEWPASAFAAPDGPLELCVAGNDPVGRLADEAVAGRMYATHPIAVRHVAHPAQTAACHMLYVAGLRDDAVAAYLDSVRDKPVLTVTDGAASRRARGVINFVVRDNRVRFEIDLDLATLQHLAVSSKLVGVAARVIPQP
jgi:hypothetical protein